MKQKDEQGVIEALELHRLTIRGIAALISRSPNAFSICKGDHALLLSGERVPDLNVLLIAGDGNSVDFLTKSVASARERELPMFVLFAPDVADILQPSAEQMGLTAVGELAMMSFRPTAPLRDTSACDIEQVVDKQGAAVAGDIQAAAFKMPRRAVANALDTSRTGMSDVTTFLGSQDGKALGAVTIIRFGKNVGIWTMATRPEHQRKGFGGAFLIAVLERLRLDGVNRFFLFAGTDAQALYRRIGFLPVAQYAAWLLADSADKGDA